MTKHKLIAEKSFLHNGNMVEAGEEFTVTASELSEYVNAGLGKEATASKTKSARARKVADTEFASENTVDHIVSKNAPQTNVADTEFGSDLTANANQNLASQQAQKNAESNSFTGLDQEHH